jgi:hypothetical protein
MSEWKSKVPECYGAHIDALNADTIYELVLNKKMTVQELQSWADQYSWDKAQAQLEEDMAILDLQIKAESMAEDVLEPLISFI